jgi:hypothetical protein
MNYIRSKSGQFSDSLAAILECDADKSIHILELRIVGDGTARTINLQRYDDSETNSAKLLPADHSLGVKCTIILNNLILEESDSLKASANVASVVDYNISYIEGDVIDFAEE